MANSKMEFRQIPEVDFKISPTGITVICPRFYTPRFIQFDIKGKCDTCRSESAEIDFLVTIDGITIYCNRMRQPIFVPFDYKYVSFPQYCLFRVKTKGKIFNVHHTGRGILGHQEKDILNEAINSVLLDEIQQPETAKEVNIENKQVDEKPDQTFEEKL